MISLRELNLIGENNVLKYEGVEVWTPNADKKKI